MKLAEFSFKTSSTAEKFGKVHHSRMSWLYGIIFLVLLGKTLGKPAVRVRVTQKGLDYAIDSAIEYAKTQLENYPLPDTKGKISNFAFDVNYAFSNMTVYNINITKKSLRSVPKKGLYTVLRNIDFDIKGKWKINLASWFTNSGTFSVAVQGMSVGILIHLGVNDNRLVVSDINCASKIENIDIDLKSGQATSFLFSWIKGSMNMFVRSRIPKIACQEGKKAIKKNLNEQFAKFPVKQHLKKSVTLDYSVVKKPEYKIDAVDLFLKGEFQPSVSNRTWVHQPATLPRDDSRDRMMYVTIMDHMINSASHAYYNQDAMRVQVTVKQMPQLLPKIGILDGYLSRIKTGLGLIKQSACSTCDLHISMSAVSPPLIRTSHSGIHLTIHAMAKINAILPNNIKQSLDVETNVTATAVPKLNGTNLSTNITDFKINTKVLNQTTSTALSGRIAEMKKIVKEQIEKLLENGISAMEIPLPLSEKFQLVKPKILYGQGYMTLEADVLII